MILALDIALTTGWCAGSPGEVPRYGSVRLKGNGSADGATLAAMSDLFLDMLLVHKPDVVAYEAPLPFHSSAQAAKLALRLSGIVELICWRRRITCHDHNVRTIRAAVVGNGNCKKDDVVAWLVRLGWTVPLKTGETDFDSVDACAVWAFEAKLYREDRLNV